MEPSGPSNHSNNIIEYQKQGFSVIEAPESGEGNNFSFDADLANAYATNSPLNFRHFRINVSDFNSIELTNYLIDSQKKKKQAKIALYPICDSQVLLILQENPVVSELDLTECQAKLLFENDRFFSTTDLFLRVIMDMDKVLLPNDITMEMLENLDKHSYSIGCPHIRSGRQLIKYSI